MKKEFTLLEDNKQEYEHFFSHHDLVISLPTGGMYIENHVNTFTQHQQYLGLSYSLPDRIIIGVVQSSNGGVNSCKIHTGNGFEDYSISDISQLVHAFDNLQGISINILVEQKTIYTSHSIHTGLFLINKLLGGQMNYETFHSISLNENRSIIQKIAFLGKDGYHSGVHALFCLTSGRYFALEQSSASLSIVDFEENHSIQSRGIAHCIVKVKELQGVSHIDHNNDKTSDYLNKAKYSAIRHLIKIIHGSQTTDGEIIDQLRRIRMIETAYSNNTLLYTKLARIERNLSKKFGLGSRCVVLFDNEFIHIFIPKQIITKQHLAYHISLGNSLTVDVIYHSDYDQSISNGPKIHQWISQGHYSPLSKSTNILLMNRHGIQMHTGTYDEALQQPGIIFNEVTNKITIDGNETTSSQIPSQKTTILLLGKLLHSHKIFINNTDLPASSYSKNKNMLISKIIAPLQKLLQEHNLPEINFEIPGSLYEYKIRLNDTETPIIYIQKIY